VIEIELQPLCLKKVMSMRLITLCFAAVLALSACTNSTSGTYSGRDVGQVIETSEGTVVSSRLVEVRGGENSNTGALAGAAVGATTGAVVAKGQSASIAAGVIGGLIGAGAGYLIEESARSREGIEYVVQMDDGRVVTIVQNRDPEEQPLQDGERVLVQYGSDYTRVIPSPVDVSGGGAGASGGGAAGAGGAAGGNWSNPDQPVVEQQYEPTIDEQQQ
jgi:outer membrane lipoprotein SlyB